LNIVIIKYNAGNIQSVLYALERIGMEAVVTDNVEQIQNADKVIFPGVGEASTAMNYLKVRKLDSVIKNLEQPVLGICLGMQLMCARSEENNTPCLGIFDETVKHFAPELPELAAENTKVPQIGWNNIYNLQTGLFKDLPENSYCYFVHGYYAALGAHTIATADYMLPYSAALHKNNFYGVQFHP
jgi:glutamine amidotransferase